MTRDSIVFICGASRSGTTWLHDALIKTAIFNGNIAEPLDYCSKSIETNEYRPSIEPGVLYGFVNRRKQDKLLGQLDKAICKLAAEFATEDRKLMLKAPHYVFCVDALLSLYGDKCHFVFISRDPLLVAFSMSKHPLISKQLLRRPKQCGDFSFGRLLFRRFVDIEWAHKKVLIFAEENWHDLTIVERALFKWHYFNRAYVLSSKNISESRKITIDYSDFCDAKKAAGALSGLLQVGQDRLERCFMEFKRSPFQCNLGALSIMGRKFYRLCVDYVTSE